MTIEKVTSKDLKASNDGSPIIAGESKLQKNNKEEGTMEEEILKIKQ